MRIRIQIHSPVFSWAFLKAGNFLKFVLFSQAFSSVGLSFLLGRLSVGPLSAGPFFE
jgi:hypothetical protein